MLNGSYGTRDCDRQATFPERGWSHHLIGGSVDSVWLCFAIRCLPGHGSGRVCEHGYGGDLGARQLAIPGGF